MPMARRGGRAIAAPRSVPPTPAKGSSTSSSRFVKNSMRRAISRGGLFAPCSRRSACPSSDGYAVVQTDFVKYSHSSPVSSFSVLRGCGSPRDGSVDTGPGSLFGDGQLVARHADRRDQGRVADVPNRREPDHDDREDAAEESEGERRPKPDRLRDHAADDRAHERHERRERRDRRVDSPEEPVADHRLLERDLAHLVDGRERVADQLLGDQEGRADRSGTGGSERDERVPDHEPQHPEEDRMPDPEPSDHDRRERRARQRADPTDRRDDPDRRGPKPELVLGEDEVGRAEDAPQDVRPAVRQGKGAKDGGAGDDPHPVPDLAQDGLAVLVRLRRGLLSANRPEEQRGYEERDRVDGDRDGRGEDLDEETADSEGTELCDRAGCREGAVGADELLAGDDRRQVCVVRDVVERREERGPERDEEQLGHSQHAEDRRHRDRAEEDRPAEVRPDHDRAPQESVDPGARNQPDDEARDELGRPDRRDLTGARVEDEDRGEGQGRASDQRPEDRDRARRPHREEAAVAPERGARNG